MDKYTQIEKLEKAKSFLADASNKITEAFRMLDDKSLWYELEIEREEFEPSYLEIDADRISDKAHELDDVIDDLKRSLDDEEE